MRKSSVNQSGTSSAQLKTRNEQHASMGGTKFIDKKQLKKSPYLKDASIWEARTDVQNQYFLQAQVTAATVYPKGSQIAGKLSRLRALSPLGQKKAKKEQYSDMSSTTFTDEGAYNDKILQHAKAERLALLQSCRGSSHAKLKQSKMKDGPTLFESGPFYDES